MLRLNRTEGGRRTLMTLLTGRPQMRIRTVMMLVVLVAMLLASRTAWRHIMEFYDLSAVYRIELTYHTGMFLTSQQAEREFNELAESYQAKAENTGSDVDKGTEEFRELMQHQAASCRVDAAWYAKLSLYHNALIRKYQRAWSHPWEAVPPDPPEPPEPIEQDAHGLMIQFNSDDVEARSPRK